MKGRDRAGEGESLNMEKRGKTRNFEWTPKRKVALECLIQAGGNVRLAAELSKKCSPSVSYGYLQELKYAPKYRPFREEYQRRTGELLNSLEVDTQYVIERYIELTRPDVPPSVRRQALRDLGQYVGLFDRKTKDAREPETTMERIAKAIEDATDPERKEELAKAAELFAEILE